MLIQRLVVSPWKSNCYLVSEGESSTQCVIVDPGITGAEAVEAALAERGLSPVAILVTHGHVDHAGSAHTLAAHWEIPVYLAEADQHQLTRPGAGLGPNGDAIVIQYLGRADLPAIEDVRDWDGSFELAGLTVTPRPAPGHTPGSTLLEVSSSEATAVFTGDVLFAGTIGRVDLPGGSMTQMRDTLRRITHEISPDIALLPGHGEPTTLAREIATNPYLQPDN